MVDPDRRSDAGAVHDGGPGSHPREGQPGRGRPDCHRRPAARFHDEVDPGHAVRGSRPAGGGGRFRSPGAGDRQPGRECRPLLASRQPGLGETGGGRSRSPGEAAAAHRGRGPAALERAAARRPQRAGVGDRSGAGDRSGGAQQDLYPVLPQRQGKRNRLGPGDQPSNRAGTRRRDPGRQQAGRRRHLHGRPPWGPLMQAATRERSRILIVEDDPGQAAALSDVLAADEREILVAPDAETGLSLARGGIELVVADYMLPAMNGVEMVRRLRVEKVSAPVLILSGEATVAVAVEAMKAGVLDFVQKPFDVDFFRVRVAQALELGRTARELVALRRKLQQRHKSELIVGVSPAIAEVRRLIGTVARTDVDVALYGETGTGKELAARAVHEHSLRGEKPFVVVDCAALPEPLLENELFCQEAGAYTGADKHARGLLAEADGGTLLVDEI